MYVSIGREETIIQSEGPSEEQAREEESEREREREHRSRGHVEDARCVTAWRGRADLDRRVEDRVRKKRKEPRRESKDKRGKKGGERELEKEGGTNKSV